MGTFEQQQGNRVATFLCYVSTTWLHRFLTICPHTLCHDDDIQQHFH